MKTKIMLLTTTFISLNLFANEYTYLMPTTPIKISEARAVLRQTDAIKSVLLLKADELRAQKTIELNQLLETKKRAIKAGQSAIDSCQREINCVKQQNEKLASAVDKIHEELRKTNEKFDLDISKENEVVNIKTNQLLNVLRATRSAVMAYFIQESFKLQQSQKDLVLETDIQFQNFTTRDSISDFLNKLKGERFDHWSVSDGEVYSTGTFYFRTSERQTKFVMWFRDTASVYDHVKADLLLPSEKDTLFGIKREELMSSLLKLGPNEYFYNSYCLGIPSAEWTYQFFNRKHICVSPLKVDTVSLK